MGDRMGTFMLKLSATVLIEEVAVVAERSPARMLNEPHKEMRYFSFVSCVREPLYVTGVSVFGKIVRTLFAKSGFTSARYVFQQRRPCWSFKYSYSVEK